MLQIKLLPVYIPILEAICEHHIYPSAARYGAIMLCLTKHLLIRRVPSPSLQSVFCSVMYGNKLIDITHMCM